MSVICILYHSTNDCASKTHAWVFRYRSLVVYHILDTVKRDLQGLVLQQTVLYKQKSTANAFSPKTNAVV